METRQTESFYREYLYGRSPYPVAPLSWVAPFLSYVCGITASTGWMWTIQHMLRFASGLLLVGPLLGTAWAASTQTRWRHSRLEPSAQNLAPQLEEASRPWQDLALPYTLPGSASHRLAVRLATASARWQVLQQSLGRPLLLLVVSSTFALTVAAQLGSQSLALVIVSLAAACSIGCRESRGTPWRWLSVAAPICIAWLVGHAAFHNLHPISIWAAGCYSAWFYGCSALGSKPESIDRGLFWRVAAQSGVVTSLIIVRQPLVAAVVAILITPQILLLPLRDSQTNDNHRGLARAEQGHQPYSRALQVPLVASMILTALALGYTL